jgi:Sporulation and spore germination
MSPPMNPRWRAYLIGMLAIAVFIAALYIPVLRRRLHQAKDVTPVSEEQARRELTQTTATNSNSPVTKAKLFWSAGARDGSLMPVSIDLPLAMDPAARAKQVLNSLLAGPIDAELRTLPPDAVLLAFYMLPDGTAIADFSEAMTTSTPSGIQSEQMAVDSITKTLEANVPQVRWLKILIHGQEVDTLAGHLDLTRTFLVNAKATPVPQLNAPLQKSQLPDSANPLGPPGKGASSAAGIVGANKPGASQKLTPGSTPGKLTPPARKP